MRVGITGHQSRCGISWSWVSDRLREVLKDLSEPIVGFSCLAAGADQVFANAILEVGGSLVVVVPQPNYEKRFSADAIGEYRRLSSGARIVTLDSTGDDEEDFFRAGQFVVDECELLIAVWDGRPARGRGGTADIVAYACERDVPVAHIEPISKTSARI